MKYKKALIFGVTGQDGSYLADFLLRKKYVVHGVKRKSSSFNTDRINHIYQNKNFILHYGDITDSLSVTKLVNSINPNEIYNLAAQSHVKVSFEIPLYTSEVNAIGTLKIIEAIKNKNKKIKFYQASTSEMFGNSGLKKQSEKTDFKPRSVYAISKVFAHQLVINYREAYDLFLSNGILFNHESPRRGETFVTKKIVDGLKSIKNGKMKVLELGNIYSKRDWGHAKDYVEAMWKILQHKEADDFVISTSKMLSVKNFVNKVAKKLDLNIYWKGKGLKERALLKKNNKTIIKINKKYYRLTEVDVLCGDYTKAKKILNWKPRYSIDQLIDDMINNNI
ncbi:MAG: GDP-mannose 4,6-dehydratase [Pelagibacteraceae bacterium TMED237]|nr:MAG: GDP-mannose 4,6-dehydratase [Pelagibacteraceae bacterium TMED237]